MSFAVVPVAAYLARTPGERAFVELRVDGRDPAVPGPGHDRARLLGRIGGVAFARVNAGQNPCGPVPVGVGVGGGNSCNEEWRTGWVAGVGVEKMFLPHWSAKIEYLHYDFGNTTSSAHAAQYNPANIGGGNWVDVLVRGDMVRAGVDYHFDLLNRI